MDIEVTKGNLADGASRFALAAALRNLALLPHEFRLTSNADHGLEVHLRVEPIREAGASKPERTSEFTSEFTRYRRTIGMLRDAKLVSEYSSVSCVDLRRAVFVEIDFGNLRTEILRAEPLPEFASIGEQGRLFDHAVVPHSGSAQPIVGDSVTWSLERWDDRHALWCNRVRSAAGGPPSEEGYVIRPDGTIDGAVLGASMADPAAEGGARLFRLVSMISDGSRQG